MLLISANVVKCIRCSPKYSSGAQIRLEMLQQQMVPSRVSDIPQKLPNGSSPRVSVTRLGEFSGNSGKIIPFFPRKVEKFIILGDRFK
jgi:hypothetical protein